MLLLVAKEMQSRSDDNDVTSIFTSWLLLVSWRLVSESTLSSMTILGAFWEMTSLSPVNSNQCFNANA